MTETVSDSSDIPLSNATTVVEPRPLDESTIEAGWVEDGDSDHDAYYAIKREDYLARLAGDDDRYPPVAKIRVLYTMKDGERSFLRSYDAEFVDGQDAHEFTSPPASVVFREPGYGKEVNAEKAREFAILATRLHSDVEVTW